jgi:hypothetical protein
MPASVKSIAMLLFAILLVLTWIAIGVAIIAWEEADDDASPLHAPATLHWVSGDERLR